MPRDLGYLEALLERFPDRDQTQIGSRGLNLSRGQRHRVVCDLNWQDTD